MGILGENVRRVTNDENWIFSCLRHVKRDGRKEKRQIKKGRKKKEMKTDKIKIKEGRERKKYDLFNNHTSRCLS